MTLPLRTLTNAGDPLCTPDGQVLSGVHVSFQLVDRYGVETDVWDALTHERVGGEPIVATTNEDGEFSIDLWPNSRGNLPTRYRCTVDHPAFKAFSGTVDHLSLDPLQWVEFMAASATIAPQDLGEMSLYRQELAAGLQTLGTAVGVAGASATASQGSASAAAAAQSAAAASAATASTQAGAAADAAGQSASSASTASTQAGVASTSATLAQQWATQTDAEVVAGQGYGARKYALDAASSASNASNAASAAAATASDLQTALSGKVDASDPRLSDAREWTAATVTQPEAEAGTDTTRRAWTAQRVFQAVAAWWAGSAAKAKLDGIATGATANATDAQLRDRTTHTGVQAISTVTGLQAALDSKQATLVSGSSLKTLGGQSLLGSGDVPLGDFLYGAYDPDNGGGSDGDVYIQSDGKMWKKAAGAWTYTGIQFAAQTAAVLLAGAQTVAGVKTLTDRSAHAGAYTPSAQPAHSATPTFDCATSNVFEPAALTGNVTSITLSNAVAGQTVQIRFQQDATGGRTVAVPAGDKVDGSINTAANRVSWLILTYSARGARWEGNWLQVPA